MSKRSALPMPWLKAVQAKDVDRIVSFYADDASEFPIAEPIATGKRAIQKNWEARTPDPFKDGRHVWFRIGAHEQLHIIADATDQPTRDIDVHLAFRVASVPDFMTHLDQTHVTYRNSTSSGHQTAGVRADGVRQIYFQDPDG
jgi:catechol 2,3-dioxygenase-like lactoylglutathione lyase family enzyme